MLQYVINALDGTDGEAQNRRMLARPHHLVCVRKLKENGNFLLGGAILNESGQMIGSIMIVQFETESAFQDWFNNDPYNTMGVWQKVEVRPFRVANV
ncbi:YciI family protein [Arcicella rosea]|uniref:Uncharacterized protein YciI n=1 Tax=Arcicella rosea TaxID=502909 RepID=A0A841EEQ5_9BACT|nr:YciI family protein [Arcicella rosea]MBB6001476.1 uncharacterized protein YciI [Arcicella rosea]